MLRDAATASALGVLLGVVPLALVVNAAARALQQPSFGACPALSPSAWLANEAQAVQEAWEGVFYAYAAFRIVCFVCSIVGPFFVVVHLTSPQMVDFSWGARAYGLAGALGMVAYNVLTDFQAVDGSSASDPVRAATERSVVHALWCPIIISAMLLASIPPEHRKELLWAVLGGLYTFLLLYMASTVMCVYYYASGGAWAHVLLGAVVPHALNSVGTYVGFELGLSLLPQGGVGGAECLTVGLAAVITAPAALMQLGADSAGAGVAMQLVWLALELPRRLEMLGGGTAVDEACTLVASSARRLEARWRRPPGPQPASPEGAAQPTDAAAEDPRTSVEGHPSQGDAAEEVSGAQPAAAEQGRASPAGAGPSSGGAPAGTLLGNPTEEQLAGTTQAQPPDNAGGVDPATRAAAGGAASPDAAATAEWLLAGPEDAQRAVGGRTSPITTAADEGLRGSDEVGTLPGALVAERPPTSGADAPAEPAESEGGDGSEVTEDEEDSLRFAHAEACVALESSMALVYAVLATGLYLGVRVNPFRIDGGAIPWQRVVGLLALRLAGECCLIFLLALLGNHRQPFRARCFGDLGKAWGQLGVRPVLWSLAVCVATFLNAANNILLFLCLSAAPAESDLPWLRSVPTLAACSCPPPPPWR